MEHCPNCGGELKIIAVILEQPVIEKIFTHLGLQARHRLVHRPVAKRLKRPDDSGSQPCRRGSAGREGYWDRWMRSGAKGQPADSVREGRLSAGSAGPGWAVHAPSISADIQTQVQALRGRCSAVLGVPSGRKRAFEVPILRVPAHLGQGP